MKIVNYSSKLSLAIQKIGQVVVVEPVRPNVNHIIIIDVSGSMYGDLPELRRHLKNKIVSLVSDGDTVSIVWFSGRGQFGVLQEGIQVRSLSDLSTFNAAVDKYLQPVGLTGFKEPIEEVISMIGRLNKKLPSSINNVFFMSDGYDNQWKSQEILDAVKRLSENVDSATFVEYGWNCNRDLLSKMAEVSGGSLIFSEDFSGYQVAFENGIGRTSLAGKKTLVTLEHPASLGYVFSHDDDGKVTTYTVDENNQVLVPERIPQIAYYVSGITGNAPVDVDTYVGLSTLSQRMRANEIFDVIGAMGDVYLANRFVNSFTKQDYSDFQNECLVQGFVASLRFKEGKQANVVPAEDAYTVLDLLFDLSKDDKNLLYPLHPSFGYKKIGAGEKQKNEELRFNVNDKNMGVPVANVVFHSSRSNASILVKMQGKVTLPKDTLDKFPNLPTEIPSFIHRNYTVIRDGIVHTRRLPVSLTADTLAIIKDKAKISADVKEGELFLLDISSLPVINRKMVKEVNAKDTFTKVFELEKLKAEQKVYKFYRDQYNPKSSAGFTALYGDEASAHLKEIGVTDYNGFNPPSTATPMNDVYMSREFDISIKGLSSLPSVNDVLKKQEANKSLTLRESLLAPAIADVKKFIESDVCSDIAVRDTVMKAWLDAKSKDAIQSTRKLNKELSIIKFSILVGHVWFNDLPPGEGSLELTIDGNKLVFNATVEDKEVN